MRIVTGMRATALGVVVCGLSGIHSAAHGTGPVAGTWELDVAKGRRSLALADSAFAADGGECDHGSPRVKRSTQTDREH